MAGIGWRHPHYGELLQQANRLQHSGLNFLEVHSENFFAEGGAALAVLSQGREYFPISLHGVGLGLGSAIGIDEWHLNKLADLAERIEPIRISDHACFARGTLSQTLSVHAADLLPIPFNNASLQLLVANVQHVQDRLKRRIAVENLSAYITWNESDSAEELQEPYFLNELASRAGCQLLVDVNNIYVNALNAHRQRILTHAESPEKALKSCCAWLDAIAIDHVAEFHLAGHHKGPDIVIDDHGSRVCDEVWALYRHAIGRFGAVPTLIEWDTDIPPLGVLLQEAAYADHVMADVLETAEATQ